ncbi:DNA gyrase subunit A [uncultured Clostridium sp.]|nr:DNA gyrase subunit A [uncultured Clostridium sp.]
MAKKRRVEPIPQQKDENIFYQSMEEVMHSSMIPYAEYVILDRALPRVEDGLKPVQRRILYTMYELGMTPDKPYRKCARIVGDCLGKYHPHGDTSVYDALVRMAQGFNMRAPLVDGHGNFGSVDGDSAAAMRYTEARMAPPALELLRDIDKDTVRWSLNFDDTLKEPDMLPGRFPNLLVNGASGIAVGLATNIPPHNMGEAIDGVIAQIDKPKITLQEMMDIVKGPDFPTGGYILEGGELEQAYATGRGRIKLRARLFVEQLKNGKKNIVITELPYQVNKAALLEKILKLREDKKGVLSAITDIRDESDREGMRAVIELRRDTDEEKVLAYLYKYSQLQVTFGINMVAIADGRPQQLGLLEINRIYIAHQKDVVTRRTRHDLEQAKAREHILAGLMIAVRNIDEVIRIIRSSQNPKEAKARLIERFALSEVQAQAILDMRLQRLTALEIENLEKEYNKILALIAELEAILSSERRLMGVIKKELKEIRDKYATPRLTQFLNTEDEVEPTQGDEVIVEDTVVVRTANGAIKRVADRLYQKANREQESGAVQGDHVVQVLPMKTNERMLAFTNLGNAGFINVEDLPDGKWRDRGVPIANFMPDLKKNEGIVALLPAVDFGQELLFFTRDGMVKKSLYEQYNIRKKAFQACGLKNNDQVVAVEFARPDARCLLITKNGMSICFGQDQVSAMGRTASGVKAIALARGDQVIFARQVGEEGEIVVISDKGYGKRSLAVDYEPQGRGGKGVKTIDFKKNGVNGQALVFVHYVQEPEELVLVQKSGLTTNVPTEMILIENRFSKGRPLAMVVLDDLVEQAYPIVF